MAERELRSMTINSLIDVPPRGTERWSENLVAGEDMHIVSLEHFIGVGKGGWSDNGHILSKNPDNPWIRWGDKPTGMEPTGTGGYFGYCGRDYYTEVGGITDVNTYESFPAGHHFLVEKVGPSYEVIAGRPLDMSGAHARGSNTTHIGVCLVGNFNRSDPPRAQLKVAARHIRGLMKALGIRRSAIRLHREVNETDCPGTRR